MNNRLKEYKDFIDALVKIRRDVLARWVTEMGWPQRPENEEINRLLSELTTEQKRIVARIVQQARDGGIHRAFSFSALVHFLQRLEPIFPLSLLLAKGKLRATAGYTKGGEVACDSSRMPKRENEKALGNT